jgi:DNA-binding CsgD family transcriptional regulator
MTLKLLCESYEALQRAKCSDELRAAMARFADRMGFAHFAYALTINAPSLKPQRYILNGYPKEWLQRYLARDYFKIDPLVQYVQNTSLPAIWDADMFHCGKSEEFWEEARSFGLAAGISFSVRDQPGVMGIFSLARDQALDMDEVELAALVGRAQLFASVLQEAVTRVDLPRILPEQNTVLTPREKECLKWTAEGKTAWEIGQILNMTERTAVFHVNNVVRKLGAANKTQAVVRAIALKLI